MPITLHSRTGTTGTTPVNRAVVIVTGAASTTETLDRNFFDSEVSGMVPGKIEQVINTSTLVSIGANEYDTGDWDYSETGGIPIPASDSEIVVTNISTTDPMTVIMTLRL